MKRTLIAGIVILLLSGCTKSFDVYFANPCDRELSIETYSLPPDRIEGEPESATGDVASLSVTKVDDAFFNAAGYAWSVVIEGFEDPIPIDGKKLKNDTIVLPAAVCQLTVKTARD